MEKTGASNSTPLSPSRGPREHANPTSSSRQSLALPYLLSLTLWHDRLRRADLLVFIDNDAARTALTKAFSRRAEGAHLVGASVTLEEAGPRRFPASAYTVTSQTAPAEFSIVDSLGARRRQIPHVVVREVLRLNECGSGGNSSYEAL